MSYLDKIGLWYIACGAILLCLTVGFILYTEVVDRLKLALIKLSELFYRDYMIKAHRVPNNVKYEVITARNKKHAKWVFFQRYGTSYQIIYVKRD